MMAYGVNFVELMRRGASYIDKILRGTDPRDLPIERFARRLFAASAHEFSASSLPQPMPLTAIILVPQRRRISCPV